MPRLAASPNRPFKDINLDAGRKVVCAALNQVYKTVLPLRVIIAMTLLSRALSRGRARAK